MPQTTPERAARWPGGDEEAIEYLMGQGYAIARRWDWLKPRSDHQPTERELDAVLYLIEEWDWGGIVENLENGDSIVVSNQGT